MATQRNTRNARRFSPGPNGGLGDRETIRRRFAEARQTLRATGNRLASRIEEAASLIVEAYRGGHGVLLFGNGGSAADAQHIACELVGRFLKDRQALRAQALSTDTSVLTAVANDFSFDQVFVRQLEANAGPGDVAWGLSTSGDSPNVVAALRCARRRGLKTIALTGRGGGKCAAHADVLLDIPSRSTQRVQEAGALVYHLVCEVVETALTV